VFSKYSFTEEEWSELTRNGLELHPNKAQEASFDEAVAEIYHRFALVGGGELDSGAASSGRSPQRHPASTRSQSPWKRSRS
jgi:hypothetical protein